MAHLIFFHQDGDIRFAVRRGRYFLGDSAELFCSIECDRNPEHDYLSAPCFALAHLATVGSIHSGQEFRIPLASDEQARDGGQPVSHLYAGEHFSPWDVQLVVESVGASEIRVSGSFATVDPNYYDARAKVTRALFMAELQRSADRRDIWWPF